MPLLRPFTHRCRGTCRVTTFRRRFHSDVSLSQQEGLQEPHDVQNIFIETKTNRYHRFNARQPKTHGVLTRLSCFLQVCCRCSSVQRGVTPLQHRAAPKRHIQTSLLICQAADDSDVNLGQEGVQFNEQFLGVLQQSLARQGADALTQGIERDEEEYRKCATEEVLEAALNQSKLSLRLMVQWKTQLEAQIAAQEKQVSRMEFALNKSRNDAAYMRSLKQMLHDYSSE